MDDRRMDDQRFDALTRSVGSHGGTRRSLLRVLAGSTLAGAVALLGLTEVVAANPKPHHSKHRAHHPHGRAVRSAGKGKGHHHSPPPPPPPPPSDPPCPDGQGQCPDGTCLPFDQCCPDAPAPLCNECYEETCVNGTLTCQHTPGCCLTGFVVCPPADGGCCAGGEYVTVNDRPFCAARWGSRVYCDSATGQ